MNQSLAQMQEISGAWPLASNISTTIVSGTLYDEQLPAALNRVWSRAVQGVIERTGARQHVISGGDRNMVRRPAMVGGK